MEQLNLQAQQAEAMANTCIAPLTLARSTAESDCRATAADQGNNANIDIFVQDVGIVMPEVDLGPPYALCCADLPEVTRRLCKHYLAMLFNFAVIRLSCVPSHMKDNFEHHLLFGTQE